MLNKDYTVTYSNNTTVGAATAIVSGIGNYTGVRSETFQIVASTGLRIEAIPDQTYTGETITPAVVVKDASGKVLKADTDYTVAYRNNIEVGIATVTVTGIGNYDGLTGSMTFLIVAKLLHLEVTAEPAQMEVNKGDPAITVKLNGTGLTENTDYTLSYQKYGESGALENAEELSDVGMYIITATGVNDYEGAIGSTVFVRLPVSTEDGLTVGGVDVSQDGNFIERTYNGQDQKSVLDGLTVSAGDSQLTADDYTVSVAYNGGRDTTLEEAEMVNAGIYVVTITGKNSYGGNSATLVVLINPKDISDLSIDVTIPESDYNAKEQTASVTVSDSDIAGIYNVTPDTFSRIVPMVDSDAKARTVDVTAINSGRETVYMLAQDTDYTVIGGTQTNAGKHRVTITGIGNYTGIRFEDFMINPAEITVSGEETITYGETPNLDTMTISGILDADVNDVTVELSAPANLNAGVHAVIASLSGAKSGNYTVNMTAKITVNPLDIGGGEGEGGDEDNANSFTAKLTPTSGYYNNQPHNPVVTVTCNDKNLTQGVDYIVNYSDSEGNPVSEMVKVGAYTVTVVGTGNYTGTLQLTYTIMNTPSGGGGGGGGGGTTDPDTNPQEPDQPDENPGVANPDDTGVSNWLNTSEHIAYLSGYPGNLFGPNKNMTRAEAAQMFYNLLLNQNVPITVNFNDVSADAWYAQAVNTLASLGIINGVGDNRYDPTRSITRAEFTTIAMRFTNAKGSAENIFSDVSSDDWFYEYVLGAIQYGWIQGYPNGTFGPYDTITRAEVTTIVNRMLGRSADESYVDGHQDILMQFNDISSSHWAYYQVVEATNAHDYTKNNNKETWTGLK